MLNLDKHLDSNEKVILFFRPARRAYIFHYIFYILLLLISLSALGYMAVFRLPAGYGSIFTLGIVRYIAWALFLFSSIMLIRIEWRILSRRYALTDERLLYLRGIFNETFKSIQYQYITDISFRQNLWDKIINTGTIIIDTASGDDEIRYRKIAKPLEVKKKINDLQSAALQATGLPKGKTVPVVS